MKLLSKKDILAQKSSERQQEIQEGLKLARRVDSLREVQAQEEASLEKFRAETLKKITTEINHLTSQRDSIKSEVVGLERRKEQALAPIVQEREEARLAIRELNSLGEELDKREYGIIEGESKVSKLLKSATEEVERAKEHKRRTEKLLQDADSKEREVQQCLIEVERERETARKLKKDTEKDLRERDANMASLEKGLALRTASLDRREAILLRAEKKLQDRKEMFERTLKRNKK